MERNFPKQTQLVVPNVTFTRIAQNHVTIVVTNSKCFRPKTSPKGRLGHRLLVAKQFQKHSDTVASLCMFLRRVSPLKGHWGSY